MDHAPVPGPVLPNRRIPTILGILGIVFASLFLLCGLCWGGSSLMSPRFMKAVEQAQKREEEAIKAKREQDLKALEEQEEAQTEAEKAEIRALRAQAKSRPTTPTAGMMDFKRMGMFDPKIMAWTWAEIGSGLAANVLLLVSTPQAELLPEAA